MCTENSGLLLAQQLHPHPPPPPPLVALDSVASAEPMSHHLSSPLQTPPPPSLHHSAAAMIAYPAYNMPFAFVPLAPDMLHDYGAAAAQEFTGDNQQAFPKDNQVCCCTASLVAASNRTELTQSK
jgi:hypothetical protein